MLAGDAALFLTIFGAPIAIAFLGLTLLEVVGSNLLEESLMQTIVKKYFFKAAHR